MTAYQLLAVTSITVNAFFVTDAMFATTMDHMHKQIPVRATAAQQPVCRVDPAADEKPAVAKKPALPRREKRPATRAACGRDSAGMIPLAPIPDPTIPLELARRLV